MDHSQGTIFETPSTVLKVGSKALSVSAVILYVLTKQNTESCVSGPSALSVAALYEDASHQGTSKVPDSSVICFERHRSN